MRAAALALALAACGGAGAATTDAGVDGAAVPDGAPPPTAVRYRVYELSFGYPSGAYGNPWEDATLSLTFTAPSGRTVDVGGFYLGPDAWRARLAPDEVGTWTWTSRFEDASGAQAANGAFRVVDEGEPGFVRPSSSDPLAWELSDGSAYRPIGIGDCFADQGGDRRFLDHMGFDGELRADCAAGDKTCATYGWTTDLDTYLNAYGRDGAGFDLFRISIDNCSFGLFDTIDPAGNTYLPDEGAMMDRLVAALRDHGFRIYFGIFGYQVPFLDGAADAGKMAAIARYVDYAVDRWGAYVDFWELMNETNAPQAWIDQVAADVRARDPYGHVVATSWQRPELGSIDVDAPHWYETEDELLSDHRTASMIASEQAAGKPVVFGEQGNATCNWDDRSAVRMRLRAWTALLREGVLVFWNSSFAKDYCAGAANLYLGADERAAIRRLQDFAARIPAGARPIDATPSAGARAYAMAGAGTLFVYAVNADDHAAATSGATVTLDAPVAGTMTFVSPSTGATLGTRAIAAGATTIALPTFTTDVAGYVTP
jgi:hypothetical protein